MQPPGAGFMPQIRSTDPARGSPQKFAVAPHSTATGRSLYDRILNDSDRSGHKSGWSFGR